jgi:hypothetical protein
VGRKENTALNARSVRRQLLMPPDASSLRTKRANLFATSLPQAEKAQRGKWRISAGYGGLILCGKTASKGRFVSIVFS